MVVPAFRRLAIALSRDYLQATAGERRKSGSSPALPVAAGASIHTQSVSDGMGNPVSKTTYPLGTSQVVFLYSSFIVWLPVTIFLRVFANI